MDLGEYGIAFVLEDLIVAGLIQFFGLSAQKCQLLQPKSLVFYLFG